MNETDVRTRILAVATRLFAHKGYGATSVREVVEEAGVTKPTLYYWFANKESLFLEAVHTQLRNLRSVVETNLGGKGSLRARLEAFVREMALQAAANRDGALLLMTVNHPSVDRQAEVDLLTVHQDTIAMLIGVLEDARARGELRSSVDVCTAAMSLMGMAHMHIMAALHDMTLPDDFECEVVRIFFEGVTE